MKTLLFVTLIGVAPLALAQDTLKVGDVSAARGTKVTGVIRIPDGVDKGLDIPVSVVHGKEPGKVLALVAGTHGYEYTSILALQRLLPHFEPGRMKGSLIVVHMANPETFYGRCLLYTSDAADERSSVDLGGRRIIKKTTTQISISRHD